MPEVITISVTETPEVVTIDVVEAVATVVNSDRTYTLLAPARRESVLPDVEHTDTGGDKVTLPAMTPMVCTPASCSGVDVKNSDDTYSQHVNDGDTLILPDTIIKNTAGTTVLNQPSCTNTGVIADCRVVNSDGTYDKLVPAETTHNLPDVPNVDSNGSTVMTPAMTPFIATPCTPYPFQAETIAFWARLSGSPDDTWKYDFDMLVIALKNAGIWSKADAMYLRAFENQADSLLKINGTGNDSTLVNAPAWVKGIGFTGNGSTKYINNNFNPTTHGVNYQLNDACFAQFVVTAGTGNYNGGVYSAGTTAISIPVDNGNVTGLNNGFISSSVGSGYKNLIAVSRNNTASFEFFVDGNTHTKTNASLSVPNGNIYELAVNAVPYGVPDGFVTSTIAFSYAGGALTLAQLQQLDGIIRWWLAKVASNP